MTKAAPLPACWEGYWLVLLPGAFYFLIEQGQADPVAGYLMVSCFIVSAINSG